MPHVTISSTMAFNVAKIASARASLTISLTTSLRVVGPAYLHVAIPSVRFAPILAAAVMCSCMVSANQVCRGRHNSAAPAD